jgi:tryptophan synthase alpha subunit
MALIKCDECGNEYSNKAPACPKCGNPTTVKDTPVIEHIEDEEVREHEEKHEHVEEHEEKHVHEVLDVGSDEAIVGSAIINLIKKNLDDKNRLYDEVTMYTMSMKNATRRLE